MILKVWAIVLWLTGFVLLLNYVVTGQNSFLVWAVVLAFGGVLLWAQAIK